MNCCIPQGLASPPFSNSGAMLIILMDQGRFTTASLQVDAKASDRTNKNRKRISGGFEVGFFCNFLSEPP